MKWIILVVFILLLIFLLLCIPFNVAFGAHLNVVENKGFYSLKVLFIKILCGRMRIREGKLEFENNNDLLFTANSNEDFINKIFINILKVIKVKTNKTITIKGINIYNIFFVFIIYFLLLFFESVCDYIITYI